MAERLLPSEAVVRLLVEQALAEAEHAMPAPGAAAPAPVAPVAAPAEPGASAARTVAIGADHGGFALKGVIAKHLAAQGLAEVPGRSGAGPVPDDVPLRQALHGDRDVPGRRHTRSAKVRSVRRKARIPTQRRTRITTQARPKLSRSSGARVPRIAQRNPSMTPTIGFSA